MVMNENKIGLFIMDGMQNEADKRIFIFIQTNIIFILGNK